MDKLLKYNGVQEALKFLREDDERTLQEHLEMCQIPAPSYEEGNMSERRWWMPVFQRCTLMRWEMCWEPGKGLGMDRELWLRDIQTLFSQGRQTLL